MTDLTLDPKRRRSILGLVFLTVFLDMVGFSIIFPLFPKMLEHYVANDGPDSLVGQLDTWLRGLATGEGGEVSKIAVYAFFGGILGSVYSLLQFVFAPFWGGLSDRMGRKPVLRLTLAGTALSYVLWIYAGPFWVLVLARMMGGIMAGNISTASAVVADICPGPERAKGMGMLGAGIGLGFVMGPAIGGLTSGWNLLESHPEWAKFGINPFSGCAAIALGLAVLNLVLVMRKFPETRPAQITGGERTRHPFRSMNEFASPALKRVNFAYFTYFLAFAAMEFTLSFLAVERLDYEPHDIAWMFVAVGLTIALVQGGFVRRLAPKLGERKLGLFGMALTVPGFLLVGFAHTPEMMYAGLFPLAAGSACVMPSLSALVSHLAPDARQGLALGIFRSLGSLSRAIGPLVGGLLFFGFGSSSPYVTAAVVMILPLVLLAGVRGADKAA
jgi:MFS family permease